MLEELYKKIDDHPRKEIAAINQKLRLIVICENQELCIELSNYFAPEHLEILAFDQKRFLKE